MDGYSSERTTKKEDQGCSRATQKRLEGGQRRRQRRQGLRGHAQNERVNERDRITLHSLPSSTYISVCTVPWQPFLRGRPPHSPFTLPSIPPLPTPPPCLFRSRLVLCCRIRLLALTPQPHSSRHTIFSPRTLQIGLLGVVALETSAVAILRSVASLNPWFLPTSPGEQIPKYVILVSIILGNNLPLDHLIPHIFCPLRVHQPTFPSRGSAR
jgi:hypothetical protein